MRRAVALVALLSLGGVGAQLLGTSPEAPRTPPVPALHTERAAEVAPLRCVFAVGERAAYRVDSRVAARGEDDGDRFLGTLSWVVERGTSEGVARLRAAWSDLRVEQRLTRPAERADVARLEAGVFSLEVDAQCRFTGLSFDATFAAPEQQLVRSLLGAAELVLEPRSGRWTATQEDTVGAYVGSYTRRGVDVERTKDSYAPNPTARQLAIQLQVLSSRLRATFRPHAAGWAERVEGRETIALRLGAGPAQQLDQAFRFERDDAAFRDVAKATAAGAPEPVLPTPTVDPAVAALSRQEVRARLVALFDADGRSAALPAARLLAAWLEAHPEAVWAWLDDLRDGALDPRAHAAFFLGLQLANTEASRDALAAAVLDLALGEPNRARAASALAEHGAAGELAAGLLQQAARDPGSPAVANASLLGLGTLAARGSAHVRQQIRQFLSAELEGATDAQATVASLDAMANSADAAFAPDIEAHLGANASVARAHAARALARVAPDQAFEPLVERLSVETAAPARVAILRSLAALGGRPFTPADEAIAAARLGSPLPEERAAAIDWVGKSAAPLIRRRLLGEHFGAEPDAYLQQRIGTYLSAADLAPAVATR